MALQIGQSGNVSRDIHPVLGDSVHGIGLEPDIGGGANLAVGGGKAARLLMGVAVCIHQGRVGVASVDGLHPGCTQDEQFAVRGVAVSIVILPDTEIGKGCILSVDFTVKIDVQLLDCHKAVDSLGSVSEQDIVAEEFCAGFDAAVTVSVVDQEPVVLPYPAGLLGESIAAMVEPGPGLDPGSLHSVAVQIQDDGGIPFLAPPELVADGVHGVRPHNFI